MKTWNIPLQRIIPDLAVQPRADLDDEYIEELVKELKAGRMFPPVVVFSDPEDYWLADGFHRYAAHQKAGLRKIKADVRVGNRREAMLHSVSANSTHGKRRTNADKRKVVLTLLKDKEWSRWTDRFIAGKCRVSQPFVSAIRKELTDNGYQFPTKRTTTNGRKMNVTRIGSNPGRNFQQACARVEHSTSKVGNEAHQQEPVAASPPVSDDIEALKAKVAVQQAALQEKDRMIEILEAQVSALRSENIHSIGNHTKEAIPEVA